jgi:transcriptional regulator with XRE-family HTH domain
VLPQEQLGVNIRMRREQKGLSQGDVSRRCGLSVSEISRLERGRRDAGITTIVRVARGIGVAPSRLLTGIR